MKVVYTDKAPAAIGPYSQAIVLNDVLFTSGQIPVDPATGEIVGDTIESQAEQVMKTSAGSARSTDACMSPSPRAPVRNACVPSSQPSRNNQAHKETIKAGIHPIS